MIGSFGKLIFEVSESRIFTPRNISREVSARVETFDLIGGKPRTQLVGAALQAISFEMTLRADFGVKPRETLRQLEKIVEDGTVGILVFGGEPVGVNRFRIQSVSEKWKTQYQGGELFSATVTVEMEEYL